MPPEFIQSAQYTHYARHCCCAQPWGSTRYQTPDATSIHISVFAFALRGREKRDATKNSQLGYHLPEVVYRVEQAEIHSADVQFDAGVRS